MSAVLDHGQTATAVESLDEVDLLEQIINAGRIGRDDEQRAQSRRQIATLVDEVLQGEARVSRDLESTITARIADIDALLSRQLNAILHAPAFQRLEASWRGLHYLVQQTETSPMLKLRVLNVSKQDLAKDLEKASEFDQSALFKKVYEEEYGTFGGAPIGALIGDYELSRHPQDLALLEKVSNVAAAAHAPFIAAASPQLFNLDSFTDLGQPRDLAKIFETVGVCQVEIVSGLRRRALCGADPAPHPHAPALWARHRARRGLSVYRGRGRHGPSEVPVGQRRLGFRRPPDRRLCQIRLVRGHPWRRRRRPGGGLAHAHLPHRRRRCGAEMPDGGRHHRPAGEGALRPRLHPPGAL